MIPELDFVRLNRLMHGLVPRCLAMRIGADLTRVMHALEVGQIIERWFALVAR